jgi:hypothetical protein
MVTGAMATPVPHDRLSLLAGRPPADHGGRGGDTRALEAAHGQPERPGRLFVIRFKPDGAIAVVRARDELDAYELVAQARGAAPLGCRIERLRYNGPRAVLISGLDFGVPVAAVAA